MVASARGKLPGSILPSTCLILLAHFFLPPRLRSSRRDTRRRATLSSYSLSLSFSLSLSLSLFQPPAGESSTSSNSHRADARIFLPRGQISLTRSRKKRNENSSLPSVGGREGVCQLLLLCSSFSSFFLKLHRPSPRSKGENETEESV